MKTFRLYQANDSFIDVTAADRNEAVLIAWRQGFGNVAVVLEQIEML